jgi:hypothetical protein
MEIFKAGLRIWVLLGGRVALPGSQFQRSLKYNGAVPLASKREIQTASVMSSRWPPPKAGATEMTEKLALPPQTVMRHAGTPHGWPCGVPARPTYLRWGGLTTPARNASTARYGAVIWDMVLNS